MTTYDWTQIRDEATTRYGEPPSPLLEQVLIDRFHDNPTAIVNAIQRVTQEFDQGTVRSPWALIRHRTQPVDDTKITATDLRTRDKRIRQSEAFIRNAGLYLPTEQELISELFDPGGNLHDWHTPDLERRMTALWEEHRPRGQQAEHDHQQRAHERARLRQHLKEAQQSSADSSPGSSAPNPATAAHTAKHAPTTHTDTTAPEPDTDPNWHHQPEPHLEVEA